MPCNDGPTPEGDLRDAQLRLDQRSDMLCRTLQLIESEARLLFGHVPKDVSDWWRIHKVDDRKRAEEQIKLVRIKSGLAKLTPEEREALGL